MWQSVDIEKLQILNHQLERNISKARRSLRKQLLYKD